MEDMIQVPDNQKNSVFIDAEKEMDDGFSDMGGMESGITGSDGYSQFQDEMSFDPEQEQEQRQRDKISEAESLLNNFYPGISSRDVIEFYARHKNIANGDAAADIVMAGDRREIEELMRPVLPRTMLEKMGIMAMIPPPYGIPQTPYNPQQMDYYPPPQPMMQPGMPVTPMPIAAPVEFTLTEGEVEEEPDVGKSKIEMAKKAEWDLRYNLRKGVIRDLEISLDFINETDAFGRAFFKTKTGELERTFEVPIMIENENIKIENVRDVETGKSYEIGDEEIFAPADHGTIMNRMVTEYESNPEMYGKDSTDISPGEVETLHGKFPDIPMDMVQEFISARRHEETGYEPPEDVIELAAEDVHMDKKKTFLLAGGVALVTAVVVYTLIKRIPKKEEKFAAEAYESYMAEKGW